MNKDMNWNHTFQESYICNTYPAFTSNSLPIYKTVLCRRLKNSFLPVLQINAYSNALGILAEMIFCFKLAFPLSETEWCSTFLLVASCHIISLYFRKAPVSLWVVRQFSPSNSAAKHCLILAAHVIVYLNALLTYAIVKILLFLHDIPASILKPWYLNKVTLLQLFWVIALHGSFRSCHTACSKACSPSSHPGPAFLKNPLTSAVNLQLCSIVMLSYAPVCHTAVRMQSCQASLPLNEQAYF